MSGQPKRALLNRRRRNPIRCGRRFVMQRSKKRPGCRQDRQISPRAGRRDGPSRGKRPGAKTVSKQNLVTKRLVDPTPATVRSRFENFLRLRTRPKAAATAFHRRVERRPTDRRPSAPGHSSGGGGAVFRTRANAGAGPSRRRLAGIPRQGHRVGWKQRAAPPASRNRGFEEPRQAERDRMSCREATLQGEATAPVRTGALIGIGLHVGMQRPGHDRRDGCGGATADARWAPVGGIRPGRVIREAAVHAVE